MLTALIYELGFLDGKVLAETVFYNLTAWLCLLAETTDQKDLAWMCLDVSAGAIVREGQFFDVVPWKSLLGEVVHEKGCQEVMSDQADLLCKNKILEVFDRLYQFYTYLVSRQGLLRFEWGRRCQEKCVHRLWKLLFWGAHYACFTWPASDSVGQMLDLGFQFHWCRKRIQRWHFCYRKLHFRLSK